MTNDQVWSIKEPCMCNKTPKFIQERAQYIPKNSPLHIRKEAYLSWAMYVAEKAQCIPGKTPICSQYLPEKALHISEKRPQVSHEWVTSHISMSITHMCKLDSRTLWINHVTLMNLGSSEITNILQKCPIYMRTELYTYGEKTLYIQKGSLGTSHFTWMIYRVCRYLESAKRYLDSWWVMWHDSFLT